MNEVYTQTIFATSDESANGLSWAPSYNIPPTFIQAGENQRLRLELNSFTIDRACWYNVNQNCSIFFVKVHEAGVDYYRYARIDNGNRVPDDTSSNDVKGRFVNAFNDATTAAGIPMNFWTLGVGTETWSPITREYEFVPTYTGGDPNANVEIIMLNLADPKSRADLPVGLATQVKLADKHYFSNNNSDSSSMYQDTHELMGCRPTTNATKLEPAFNVVAGPPVSFKSPFPSKDESNQNIYVRLDQPNDNIQSEGHNPISKDNPSNMEISNIIGKIPVPRWLPTDQTPTCPLISADANVSQFGMNLYTNHVPNFQISITDAEGRRFPFAGYNYLSGLYKFFQFEISFKLILIEDRVETIKRQLIFQSEMLEKIAELETITNKAETASIKLSLMNPGNK